MKIFILFLCIITSFFNNHTHADQLIMQYLVPYPTADIIAQSSTKLAKKIHRPGKLASTTAKHIIPASVAGIFATYGGYLTISDLNGEIAFGRRHTKPFIYYIVTELFTPILIGGNTIHHWELVEGSPAKMYKMAFITNEQTGVTFWEITAEPLPTDKFIPLESLVIIANPKYVYVPLGIIPANASPHLIFPDVYIKPGMNLTEHALYMLNLSQYFGAIIPIYKKEPLRYSRQLTY